jgi:SSS family solute:Na+ symporter
VFILGVFWRRTNARGALWGMIAGFSIGMFRLLLNVIYGLQTALIVEAEKYAQKIGSMTGATKELVLQGIQGLSERIATVMGTAGDQYKATVDNAYQALASGEHQKAANLLHSVRANLDTLFTGQYGFLFKIAMVNWLHFTVFLFLFCVVVIVGISLLTRKPDEFKLQYTYKASSAKERAESRASWNMWDIVHSVIILGIIVLFYWYFW